MGRIRPRLEDRRPCREPALQHQTPIGAVNRTSGGEAKAGLLVRRVFGDRPIEMNVQACRVSFSPEGEVAGDDRLPLARDRNRPGPEADRFRREELFAAADLAVEIFDLGKRKISAHRDRVDADLQVRVLGRLRIPVELCLPPR